MKALIVTMSDDTRWSIPVQVIAEHRANYYRQESLSQGRTSTHAEQVYQQELDKGLSSNAELKYWAEEQVRWSDVESHAKQILPYAYDWRFAKKDIVECDES